MMLAKVYHYKTQQGTAEVMSSPRSSNLPNTHKIPTVLYVNAFEASRARVSALGGTSRLISFPKTELIQTNRP